VKYSLKYGTVTVLPAIANQWSHKVHFIVKRRSSMALLLLLLVVVMVIMTMMR